MDTRLKSCPFCGGDAELDYDPMPIGTHYRYSVFAKHQDDCYLLLTDKPFFETADETIKAWDTRAPNAELTRPR